MGSGRHRILEGSYIRVDGDIYAVKGVLHPRDKIIALPVYIKSSGGYLRIRSFREAMRYLELSKPKYLERLDFTGQVTPVVPVEDVERIYDPLEFYTASTEAGRDALDFKKMIESSIGIEVGVSGSILLGLDSPSSDIDLVVYGLEDGRSLIDELRELRIRGIVKPARTYDWIIETRRDSSLSPERWLEIESRKLLTGTFRDRLYTLKIVPLPSEYWEDISQKVVEVGRSGLVCKVTGSRFSKTTPNMYDLEVLKVLYGDEVAWKVSSAMSMRSRFAEIAEIGDRVMVEGRVEEVILESGRSFRVFLGNDLRDVIIPL
ncbi:MAG: hypothetical protein ABDH32_02930 [Candidatus Caldarchaeales archaeon]